MDFKDQLKKLFPEHVEHHEEEKSEVKQHELWIQKEPLLCKYEKRKGKPITIISGYEGEEEDFKIIAKELKNKLAVGGTYKDKEIIIQGDYRNQIINWLEGKGFKTKIVGG